jgi:hypothetical protein
VLDSEIGICSIQLGGRLLPEEELIANWPISLPKVLSGNEHPVSLAA